MTRDLDLCRDADLLVDEGDNAKDKPWMCLVCGNEFNKLELEEKLVGEIQALIAGWATQDLKCERCGALRMSEFMEHCSCSGTWVETMRKDTIVKKLKTFKSVGEYYDLKMLTSLSTQVLERT
ncbi:DNA polymerase epsilon catalytic subunit [Ascosphaera atra]|nr:DNA polymerase epsilon catalytic subunit [Ascosphaera atra]